MTASDIQTSFIFLLIASYTLQLWLSRRHSKHIQDHRAAVPAAFADKISLEAHQKAADYTTTRNKFGLLELSFSTIVLAIWTLGGGLQLLDNVIRTFEFSPIFTGIIVIFGLGLISGFLDLPFTLYKTFVIEEKFGFNRLTLKMFITDTLKSTTIMLIIGLPFLYFVLWLMDLRDANPYWWLYVWGSWFGFSMLMMWLYPTFIAPIFNKFTPLDEPELKSKITQLLERCGFTSNGVFIMDGSKRSSHGNAYFTGFGSNKRIVFFDTLLNSLQHNEIEAVLAHELGHFKRNHIKKRILTMALMSLGGLALLAWLIDQTFIYEGLGVSQVSSHMALILFMLVTPLISIFLTPIFSLMSRKHEFEADEFAAENTDANNLITALVKLYEENSNTLTPDPLYSAFYDSHPPAPVRVAHLTKL
ncbi:Uncharacterized integral membrane endopeptidase Bmul_2226 [hydrothermal vent metagenome]|uniref:Uncharacterized integral membrane endopeptidase Bmul_2226 n=1 Tax=hydrothermal vent metagenome TaxID=652676 RepID=A0A3B1AHR4_9ZZZZ